MIGQQHVIFTPQTSTRLIARVVFIFIVRDKQPKEIRVTGHTASEFTTLINSEFARRRQQNIMDEELGTHVLAIASHVKTLRAH